MKIFWLLLALGWWQSKALACEEIAYPADSKESAEKMRVLCEEPVLPTPVLLCNSSKTDGSNGFVGFQVYKVENAIQKEGTKVKLNSGIQVDLLSSVNSFKQSYFEITSKNHQPGMSIFELKGISSTQFSEGSTGKDAGNESIKVTVTFKPDGTEVPQPQTVEISGGKKFECAFGAVQKEFFK